MCQSPPVLLLLIMAQLLFYSIIISLSSKSENYDYSHTHDDDDDDEDGHNDNDYDDDDDETNYNFEEDNDDDNYENKYPSNVPRLVIEKRIQCILAEHMIAAETCHYNIHTPNGVSMLMRCLHSTIPRRKY
uniref:Uncharacterized protein n=1 Tax=Glossina austeni TaxID=7395 RepID=A0A1A9UY36_GLOAU